MSAGGAFGGNRGMRPVPPEKGVFRWTTCMNATWRKRNTSVALKHQAFNLKFVDAFQRSTSNVVWRRI
ncbi:hypothetical protein MKX01_018175 [Papaver californicum]|nr:hypothetical protein MKX01_018175 [Papaver californicum]